MKSFDKSAFILGEQVRKSKPKVTISKVDDPYVKVTLPLYEPIHNWPDPLNNNFTTSILVDKTDLPT